MGSISSGVGLVSGIDIASLIDSLITLESAGKFRLEDQIGTLQAQQTALLDINARLLSLKSASAAFRTTNTFQSALATSSNEEILTATASSSAQPGTFKFIVKQLVSTSQKMSAGFASRDASPLGLDALSFEFGNGSLARDRSLDELNGGAGVDRGRITITDRTGTSQEIDLTDVTSVNEVLDRINSAGDIAVTASVQGDQIVLNDTSGATTSNLKVTNATGDTTATDLGIVGDVASSTLTGSDVYYLAGNVSLDALNDGNGVLVRENIADIVIQTRDLRVFEIDLGRIDAPIELTTDLSELNNGNGVTINDDTDDPDLHLVARDGSEYDVELTGATTVGEVASRISTQTGGHITLSIDAEGEHLVVTDTVGGSGALKVEGAGVEGTATAEGLGILEETGVFANTFDGEIIPNTISDPPATTLQDVIDRINNAVDTTDTDNGGHIVASISADGRRIQIDDTVGGPQNLQIFNANASDTFGAATDLGIYTPGFGEPSTQKVGGTIFGGLDSVIIGSINGGSGLGGATTINVTDRDGQSFSLATLDTYDTLQDVIDEINNEAVAQGVQVTVGLNSSGNGLTVTDTSGGTGTLQVSGDAATALGIDFSGAADSAEGTNLQLQYVAESSKLADLNYGRGVGTGSFRITDGLGDTAVVDIGGTETTVYDVIAEINSRGLAVQARINDNGDGIIIEEDAAALGGETPFVKIKVASESGTAAADLNLVGESDDVVGGYIDGSYERTVALDTSDSLDDVISKINEAGIPVSATIVNSGSGSTPFRLSVTSGLAGTAGQMIIDTGGVDLGFTTLSEGRDAKVFFGADDPENGLLVTSTTNTLTDVVDGLTIDLVSASDDVVTVNVERDQDSIVGAMQSFVASFNDVVDRVGQYDFFDSETEQRGVLLGDPTLARVRTAMYRVAQTPALNVGGSLRYLSQVGVGFDGEGKMTFDAAEFREAYDADPEAVEALIATYDVSAAADEQIADGVTVEGSGLQYNALGVANIFDRLLDDLTNSIDGVLTLADDAYESRIDLINDRIEQVDNRLDARRARLTQQFVAMEQALSQLQAQSGALGSLSSNLSLASNRISFGG